MKINVRNFLYIGACFPNMVELIFYITCLTLTIDIVRSDTSSATDQFHLRGVVQTEVVKGNIPVKNGVVHLISKPLTVIDSTVYQTLAVGHMSATLYYKAFKMVLHIWYLWLA